MLMTWRLSLSGKNLKSPWSRRPRHKLHSLTMSLSLTRILQPTRKAHSQACQGLYAFILTSVSCVLI